MNRDASPSPRAMITRQAGSLSLALWHDGTAPDELGGFRRRYAYRIAESTRPGIAPHDGRDIYSGVGDDVDTTRMMGTLVNLLSAAGEAYMYGMSHPGSDPENLGMFPEWVVAAAYMNSDELTMLTMEFDPMNLGEPEATPIAQDMTDVSPAAPTARAHAVGDGLVWPPGRYYTVVFLQDEEGHATVDMLHRSGADAVIEHLAQWDFGSETLDAALFNTHVYPELPVYQGTRVAEGGPYVLMYHPAIGNVHLLREFPTDLERPAWWPDRYTGITSRASIQPETPAAPRLTTGPTGPQTVRPEPPRGSSDDGLSL